MTEKKLLLSDVSFVIPSRNNLKYLEWCYTAIRKNIGPDIKICMADDASTDGTWDWMNRINESDENVSIYRNTKPKRVGHTILYDHIINTMVTTPLFLIAHADMYWTPGSIDAMLKHVDKKVIVSATRIEPPLHPDGPEKVLQDFGIEPEEFDEEGLLEHINTRQSAVQTTEGIFAPWMGYVEDFQEIGGHDPLYRPQSKEDTDIFNRFQLNGVKFVQTWEGFVYHMTCRGSRRNTVDKAKNIYEDSPEWLAQNQRSTRNFIRKWGHFCKHDEFMKPIIPNKYDIGFRVTNCNPQLLEVLEPWCNVIYVDCGPQPYIDKEQPNTDYDLNKRVHSMTGDNDKFDYNDIVVEIEGSLFRQDDFQYITQLSEILDQGFENGSFELGTLKITVTHVESYTNELITLQTKYNDVLHTT